MGGGEGRVFFGVFFGKGANEGAYAFQKRGKTRAGVNKKRKFVFLPPPHEKGLA